jgi:hypothetical protein
MARTSIVVLFAASILLLANISSLPAQEPDATVKITRRSVAEAVGLSWGDGVLTYKGRDYPFTFQATGLFRGVDPGIAAAELSGQLYNLKNLDDFSGNYRKVEAETPDSGSGTRATIKNQNGVVVNLLSTVAGRKFNFGSEGMDIQLKK